MTGPPLLELIDLTVTLAGACGPLAAVRHVGFEVDRGRTLGVVGESGCGKSLTLRALMGLLPESARADAEVRFDQRVFTLDRTSALRGAGAAMIFQDASTALDPVLSVGAQLREVLRAKSGLSRREAGRESVRLFGRVGIPAAARRQRAYPHELSGGMRQRVMIAMAIAGDPALLLADEPTTALDVTVQAQILELLQTLQDQTGMAMILVSHDMAVVGEMCDDIAVMYAGTIVERGSVETVLSRPRHPYTIALLAAVPTGAWDHSDALTTIGGQPPDLGDMPAGCPFAPRCEHARERCSAAPMILDHAGHGTTCVRAEELRL
jgi:oligopeptide/dipeptide ABC transporter ATP-binding protein